MTLDDHASDAWFHSNGGACGQTQSAGVTDRWLDATAPVSAGARCRDSAALRFAGGNAWKPIGSWTLELPG
jgi:hypothetical protein